MAKPIFKRSNKHGMRPPKQREPLLRELCRFQEISGMTMTEVCIKAGYPATAFSKIRRGLTPNFPKVVNLGEALGYELVWRKR